MKELNDLLRPLCPMMIELLMTEYAALLELEHARHFSTPGAVATATAAVKKVRQDIQRELDFLATVPNEESG